MRVLIDSSYWVAKFNSRDHLHARAVALARTIPTDAQLFTNNLVVYECVTVLAMRSNRINAIRFGDLTFRDIDEGLIFSSIIDESKEREIWDIFRRLKTKDISFVDCSILATIKEFRIDALLSFDRHFVPLQHSYRFKLNAV